MTDSIFDYNDYALEDQQLLTARSELFLLVHSKGIPIVLKRQEPALTVGIRIGDGWIAIDPDNCTLTYLESHQADRPLNKADRLRQPPL